MLKTLTKLMALYKSTIANRRLERRQLIQNQLDEANSLVPQIDSLLSDIEREQAELTTYLDVVSKD